MTATWHSATPPAVPLYGRAAPAVATGQYEAIKISGRDLATEALERVRDPLQILGQPALRAS